MPSVSIPEVERLLREMKNQSPEAQERTLDLAVDVMMDKDTNLALFARKDLCHELQEFVDALSYLTEDFEMVKAANQELVKLDAKPTVSSEEVESIYRKQTDLKKTVETVIAGLKCPQSERYSVSY